MINHVARACLVLLPAIMSLAPVAVGGAQDVSPDSTPFPHGRHERVFTTCTTCHAGALDAAEPLWPQRTACASCHDGVIRDTVPWAPRVGARPGNLRFTHAAHDRASVARNASDSAIASTCAGCHVPDGEGRMAVARAVIPQCFSCHQTGGDHVNAPRESCARCHVRLTEATLSAAQVARFPTPTSHSARTFVLGGHGELARMVDSRTGEFAAPSCATCHARNLCIGCHVNAPESRVVRSLAIDARFPTVLRDQPAPPEHANPGFLRTHGREAGWPDATCAVCHARESCATCHTSTLPLAAAALPAAGPGRAPGARPVRAMPSSHTAAFRTQAHSTEASARPVTCETCHQRSSCLECHRPDGARRVAFHPTGFLTRHPASAYARASSCADCHNAAQFCQSCHQRAGLVALNRIGQRGYHDAFRGFSLGHGQAARQSLESCASCHAERDCTACHSAVGAGFRFSPHGRGFNADRMRAKNPSMCIACHGNAIPR